MRIRRPSTSSMTASSMGWNRFRRSRSETVSIHRSSQPSPARRRSLPLWDWGNGGSVSRRRRSASCRPDAVGPREDRGRDMLLLSAHAAGPLTASRAARAGRRRGRPAEPGRRVGPAAASIDPMPRKQGRSPGRAFTVDLPRPLPAERRGDAWWATVDGRELRLSNLDKVFWPDEGITKGDLLAYYYNVAPLIVPHLAGRPLTMKRMPDGLAGGAFYEKSAPSHTPDWMLRCPVPSDDSKRGIIDYLVLEDAAGLLFVANLGCIEFHPLHSRCADVEHPDYLFFDLDPFEPITFDDVLAAARLVKITLDQLGLVGYPKTSGATGMQIYVPVERGRYTYDEVRELVGTAGRLIQHADPDHITMAWQIKDRSGKVFIDHNMNRAGANIAAAYSVRPEAGAPVSTPLTWGEVA